MKNLTKEHCAKVLNDWAAHHVKNAEKRYVVAQSALQEERVQLRIANAVEEERKRTDYYYGTGWGEPTPEQRFAETMKRVENECNEAARVLQNNKDMQEYVREITSKV
jgi:hypothetical protein